MGLCRIDRGERPPRPVSLAVMQSAPGVLVPRAFSAVDVEILGLSSSLPVHLDTKSLGLASLPEFPHKT